MSESGIDPRFFREVEGFAAAAEAVLPKFMFRALRRGLFDEGQSFKKQFRENLNTRFKIKKSKVGNLFKVYTAGTKIGSLELGVFTVWAAGQVYEAGGTISSSGGNWLMVALDKRAYTAGGRIKRSWRDPRTGKFAPDKLADLGAIPIKGGRMFLLYEQQKQVTSAAQARQSGVNVGLYRAMALQPRFLLIRQTRRSPVLKFFADFLAYVRSSGGLDEALGRAIEAFGRVLEK